MTDDPAPRPATDLHFGHAELDSQHQQLLGLLATFNALARHPQVTDALHDAYHELMNYVFHHFALEEDWLARHGYPALQAHQESHRLILIALTQMAEELMQPDTDARALVRRLQAMAQEHLDGPDHDCAQFLQQRPAVH